jgi:hypothetical protein
MCLITEAAMFPPQKVCSTFRAALTEHFWLQRGLPIPGGCDLNLELLCHALKRYDLQYTCSFCGASSTGVTCIWSRVFTKFRILEISYISNVFFIFRILFESGNNFAKIIEIGGSFWGHGGSSWGREGSSWGRVGSPWSLACSP